MGVVKLVCNVAINSVQTAVLYINARWSYQRLMYKITMYTLVNGRITHRALTRMQNGGKRPLVFAKMVVLATLSTLRLAFILMKF